MDIGESRFTFKCLSCGRTSCIGGKWFGTGTLSHRIWEHASKGCASCGAPIVNYLEEMRYDWDEYGEKVFQKEYDEARAAYLGGRWTPPPEPEQPHYHVPFTMSRLIDCFSDSENLFWRAVFCCCRGIWFCVRQIVGFCLLCAFLAGIGECVKFIWHLFTR